MVSFGYAPSADPQELELTLNTLRYAIDHRHLAIRILRNVLDHRARLRKPMRLPRVGADENDEVRNNFV